MKVAVLPVNVSSEIDKQQSWPGATHIDYVLSYIEKYYPDDNIFVEIDIKKIISEDPDIICIYEPSLLVHITENPEILIKSNKSYGLNFSNPAENYLKISNYAKEFKGNTNAIVILIGSHATYFYDLLPSKVDIGIVGEEEKTLRDLITLYKEFGELTSDMLEQIPGVTFHGKNKVIFSGKGEYIDDLDEIPFSKKYFLNIPMKNSSSIYGVSTGRGSPHDDFYGLKTKPVKHFSMQNIMENIVGLLKIGNNIIHISDDILLSDTQRLYDFAVLCKDLGISKRANFIIGGKPHDFSVNNCAILNRYLKTFCVIINTNFPNFKVSLDPRKKPLVDKGQKLIKEAIKNCFNYNLNPIINYNNFVGSMDSLSKSFWYIRQNYSKETEIPNIEFSNFIPLTRFNQNSYSEIIRFTKEEMKDREKSNSVLKNKNSKNKPPLLKRISKYNLDQVNSKTNLIFDNFNGMRDFLQFPSNVSPLKDSLLEFIIKDSSNKNILQINKSRFFDLPEFFKFENFEIDYLSLESFNLNKFSQLKEKKYDCVVLYFALDLCKDPNSLLDYCYSVLKDQGQLIISFYNSKSIVFLNAFLTMKNIANTFDKKLISHYMTLKKVESLLLENNFVLRKYNYISLPLSIYSSYKSTKYMVNTLSNYIKTHQMEYFAFSYVYSARKN